MNSENKRMTILVIKHVVCDCEQDHLRIQGAKYSDI